MSGIYLLLLFSIWVVVGYVLYKLLRAIKKRESGFPFLSVSIGVVFLGLWFGWPFWEMFGKKMYWDAKVREMCAIDGGVKVYETVELPEDRFDKYGNLGIKNKRHAKFYDEYYFESEDIYLREEDPKIIRSTTRIIRRSDEMVLGESIRYGRGGGDLPGPWHTSSYDCPQIKNAEGKLESSIFVKGVK